MSKPLDSFPGFGPRAVSFWDELAQDNSKAFFDARRETYEQDIRIPLEQLLAEVAEEFGDGKVFRPNRDVRFSPDKSPYELHAGAWSVPAGLQPARSTTCTSAARDCLPRPAITR